MSRHTDSTCGRPHVNPRGCDVIWHLLQLRVSRMKIKICSSFLLRSELDWVIDQVQEFLPWINPVICFFWSGLQRKCYCSNILLFPWPDTCLENQQTWGGLRSVDLYVFKCPSMGIGFQDPSAFANLQDSSTYWGLEQQSTESIYKNVKRLFVRFWKRWVIYLVRHPQGISRGWELIYTFFMQLPPQFYVIFRNFPQFPLLFCKFSPFSISPKQTATFRRRFGHFSDVSQRDVFVILFQFCKICQILVFWSFFRVSPISAGRIGQDFFLWPKFLTIF